MPFAFEQFRSWNLTSHHHHQQAPSSILLQSNDILCTRYHFVQDVALIISIDGLNDFLLPSPLNKASFDPFELFHTFQIYTLDYFYIYISLLFSLISYYIVPFWNRFRFQEETKDKCTFNSTIHLKSSTQLNKF